MNDRARGLAYLISPKEMSDYNNSGQDALSSDSEESFENENELGSQLQDSRQESRSIDGAANGTSLLEEPVPADLEYLPLHKDSEKRQKQFSGAHVQGKRTIPESFDTL